MQEIIWYNLPVISPVENSKLGGDKEQPGCEDGVAAWEEAKEERGLDLQITALWAEHSRQREEPM